MAKNKWYKSKGGWIGIVISSILLYLWASRYGVVDFELIFAVLFTNIFKEGYGQIFTPIVYISLILGFIVGYFIEKKFFKKRR